MMQEIVIKSKKESEIIMIDKVLPWPSTADNKGITKEFIFENFDIAWAFMNEVAKIANKLDHHPDWSNVYNKVNITLCTHDEGKVTEKDTELALNIDLIEAKFKS